ncbi:tlde1 domain-containing protein [Roseibium sp. FZY0029]|uniref:DUF2778 domain-containing protein n=1 Tax=Roseibium sp. FZY0029 TaxID=3116647 RepID=UPI002EB2ACE4|nr:tlde1 domain-containing protein [Roseibium sp. FZY0029]
MLAGATLVIAGLAGTATYLGTSISPSHFAANGTVSQDKLTLAQAAPAAASLGLAPIALTPKKQESSKTVTALAAEKAAAEAAAIAEKAEAALKAEAAGLEAEAKKAAKVALAAKLARLKLTQTLLARQVAAQSTSVAALDDTAPQETAPDIAVAALQGVGTAAEAETNVEAKPEETTVALAAGTPAKPGAILPPTPDMKPEPPRRSAPVVAENRPEGREKPEQTSPVLAYATPGNPEEDDNGVFGGLGKLFGSAKPGLPGAGSKIAVYDISAATVHMPDGTKLEAHSGIGHRMDNPKFSHVKMLGPTPPNIYTLRMRERRFHGVEAIRMLPQDRAAMKGRDGMLTHTRLLRRSIGSHGCVAFKDYNKFLNAFKRGHVKTLIVVPSMEKLPTYMAKLQRSTGV